MTSLGSRRSLPERLDQEEVPRDDAERSLRELSRINARLGGDRPLRRHLRDLRDAPSLSLLDVGGGGGDVPVRLRAWARAGGGRWRAVVLDRHPILTGMARRRVRDQADVVRGDARRLPFPDDAFDVVTCNLVLHHFDDRDAVAVLEEMGRVARQRVLVNDLERHWLHYTVVRALAATLWRRDPVTSFDAPRSVLRAFTADELAELARRASLPRGGVKRHFPFRLVLDAVGHGPGPRSEPP